MRSLSASAAASSVGSLGVDHEGQVEVAVADVADDRRDEAVGRDVRLGLEDAFGEARDRHADVGRQAAPSPARSALAA